MLVEDMLKNFEKFQKELGHGKFSGSPWNSPEAQHNRLFDSRTKYFARRGKALKGLAVAVFWSAVAIFIFIVFNGPPRVYVLVQNVAGATVLGFLGYCVYVLRKTPPEGEYKCPHCDAPTLLHDPWVCGHCQTTHRPTRTSRKPPTWVESCSKCKNVAHSLICYHCHMPSVFHQLNFFRCPTEGAYLVGYSPQSAPPQDDIVKRLEGILK